MMIFMRSPGLRAAAPAGAPAAGNPLAGLFGRLTGSLAGGPPPVDPRAGGLAPPPVDPSGRPAMDTDAPPGVAVPQAEGVAPPVEGAAWRTSYEAFVAAIQVTESRDLRFSNQVAFPGAPEFGAWYDLIREAGQARSTFMNDAQDRAAGQRSVELYQQAEALAPQIQVEWTARVIETPTGSHTPSQLELPELPAPLRMSFYVDQSDKDNWAHVKPGDVIRFTGRFESADLNQFPVIGVHMTLKEAAAR